MPHFFVLLNQSPWSQPGVLREAMDKLLIRLAKPRWFVEKMRVLKQHDATTSISAIFHPLLDDEETIDPDVDTTHDIAAALRKKRRLLRSSLKAIKTGEPLLRNLRRKIIGDPAGLRSRSVDELAHRMNARFALALCMAWEQGNTLQPPSLRGSDARLVRAHGVQDDPGGADAPDLRRRLRLG